MLLGRKDWVFLGAALLVALVCMRLGAWQVDRLGQRRARNAVMQHARERAPLALPAPGLPAESLRQRRVVARGTYDYSRERLWRPRVYDGTVGVGLITPLRLADGAAVLVDRGWVPALDLAGAALAAYREGDSLVTVEGLAVAAPRAPGDVDPLALADSVPYPLLPFVVQLATDAASRAHPPLRLPPPRLDDGPHLSYAIQWFSFALIVLVGTALLVRRERSAGASR